MAGQRGNNPRHQPKRGNKTCWDNRKYGAGKLNFSMRNYFSEDYPPFAHAPSKIFASPVLGRRSLNNVGFRSHQIINLPGAPTSHGPALFSIKLHNITPYKRRIFLVIAWSGSSYSSRNSLWVLRTPVSG